METLTASVKAYGKMLLLIGTALMLILSIGSCKKDKKIEPAPVTPKNTLTGKIDGNDFTITESAITSTVYTTPGDNVKSLETSAALDASGSKLTFFINDLKNGALALAAKTGTSANPGSRTIKINATGTSGVQSYVQYFSGGNTYYAYSGSIEMTITETTISVKWSITFKDASGREFTSAGSFSINFASVITKAKSEVKDPTPVADKPTIENISPNEGRAGDTVAFTGVNYSTTAGDNIIKFNGTDAVVLTATATKLTAKVPAQGTTGNVSVKVKNSEVAAGPVFSYIQGATITSLAPATGKAGDTITVNGTSFSTTASQNVVKFNGPAGLLVGATVVSSTAAQLKVIVPQSAATGTLSLNIKGGATLLSPVFTVTAPQGNSGAWEQMSFSAGISESNFTATNGTSFMFATTSGYKYLYYSANGTTYTNVYDNLPFDKTNLNINLIKADGAYYYVSTTKGIARTSDGGATWKKLTPDLQQPDKGFVGMNVKANNVTLLDGGYQYFSSSYGDDWVTSFQAGTQSLSFITSDYNSKYFFAINEANNFLSATGPRKLFISADGGKTWGPTAATTGIYFFGSGNKEFLEISGTTIYCLFSAETTRASISDQRLYRSTTRGDSWTKVSDDNAMFVKSFGDYIVYSDNSSLSVSNDAGNTFKKYSLPAGYFAGSATRAGGYLYIIAYSRAAPATYRIFRQKI